MDAAMIAGIAVAIIIIIIAVWYFTRTRTVETTPNGGAWSTNTGGSGTRSSGRGPQDGDVLRCMETGATYKIVNGQKRLYSAQSYAADGSPTPFPYPCNMLSAMPSGPNF